MGKRTIQDLADARLAAEYRQPVKTLEQAVEAIGWALEDRPKCCGEEVEISSFIGSAYQAVCRTCGKFIFDVTGPEFNGRAICLPDQDKYDLDHEARWVSGQEIRE